MVINLCGSVAGNTGQIACDTKRGLPKVLIIGGAQFDPADYATSEAFKTALLASIKKANGDSTKMFPFPEISGNTNNTEANTTATTGYGQSVILREGRPSYTFDIRTGTNTEKKLRKFNRQIVPVMVFDDNGNVWGRKNAQDKFVGTAAEIYVSAKPFDDGSNISYTQVSVFFQSMSEFADDAAFVSTDFSTSDLEGLLDATLHQAAATASNVLKIGVKVVNASLGNDVNLHDTYATELASASLWTIKNIETGEAISVTSVASNAAGYFDVTADSTAWTALTAGKKVQVGLAAPSVLDAADVVGLEGSPVVITK